MCKDIHIFLYYIFSYIYYCIDIFIYKYRYVNTLFWGLCKLDYIVIFNAFIVHVEVLVNHYQCSARSANPFGNKYKGMCPFVKSSLLHRSIRIFTSVGEMYGRVLA